MDPTIVVVMCVVVLAVGVGAFLFLRGRGGKEESFYHFRCPKCRRRLRYQARQVGRKAKCSHCGNELTFPPVSQSID